MVYVFLFLLSCLLTPVYIGLAKRWQVLDIPNARSSHQHITPRGGGLVFLSIWLIWLWYQRDSFVSLILMPPISLLMVIGFWDDRKGLPANQRFLGQFLAAGLFVSLLAYFLEFTPTIFDLPTWIGLPILLVAIVWSTNLYNFMDGIDGIAGLQGLFIFLPMSCILMQYDAWPLVHMLWALSAALSGFLVWNWPVAKLFMGDVGSSVLGFLVAAFALLAYYLYHCPLWCWLVLYSVFWFDATVTLCRRAWHRQRVWEGHRLHAYQRLHQSGRSHIAVLGWVAFLNSLLVVLTCINIYQDGLSERLLLALTLGILALYYRRVEQLKPFSSLT